MKEEVREVLEKIEKKGFMAYVVGGYPRDLLLGRECFDFDICTNATKEELRDIFSIEEENFGCVKIHYRGIPFEITTFRREIHYVDVRTPVIEYTSSLEEDLKRRDFTMNTLCMDKEGNILDFYHAKEDIEHKIIRSLPNVFQKLEEDPLRILRAIRFATVLSFSIDDTLNQALMQCGSFIKRLSSTRKKEELDKIFLSPNQKIGLELLEKYQLYPYLGGHVRPITPTTSRVGIWAQIKDISEYNFSKQERKEINGLRKLLTYEELTNYQIYSYDFSMIQTWCEIKQKSISDYQNRYRQLPIHRRGDIALDVSDFPNPSLISTGYKYLEEKILNGETPNEKENLVQALKEYFLDKEIR